MRVRNALEKTKKNLATNAKNGVRLVSSKTHFMTKERKIPRVKYRRGVT